MHDQENYKFDETQERSLILREDYITTKSRPVTVGDTPLL